MDEECDELKDELREFENAIDSPEADRQDEVREDRSFAGTARTLHPLPVPLSDLMDLPIGPFL